MVPPPNVGVRTTPLYNDTTGTLATNPISGKAISGAASSATTDPYTMQTRYNFSSGGALFTTFCGSREDGFSADIPGTFDLLDPRILDNNGSGLTPPLVQDGNGASREKSFQLRRRIRPMRRRWCSVRKCPLLRKRRHPHFRLRCAWGALAAPGGGVRFAARPSAQPVSAPAGPGTGARVKASPRSSY